MSFIQKVVCHRLDHGSTSVLTNPLGQQVPGDATHQPVWLRPKAHLGREVERRVKIAADLTSKFDQRGVVPQAEPLVVAAFAEGAIFDAVL